jgi:hypothetical protein
MNLKITPYHFEELLKEGFTLDLIFLLKLIEEEYDVKALCNATPKLQALCQTLYRKNLVSDNYKITIVGRTILEFLASKGKATKIIKKTASFDEFEKWWKAYPGTDIFTHKGKEFTGSRTLRVYKNDCQAKFDKILSDGEYTAEQMIQALEYEILQKKENSIKTGTNRLSFMQGSLVYLNQRSFEPFIELIKEGKTVKETPIIKGTTDI